MISSKFNLSLDSRNFSTNLESEKEFMATESNASDDSLVKNKDGEGRSVLSAEKDENKNVDQLLSASISDKVNQASNSFSVHRCIHRIPGVLRKHNEKSFVPSVVSIGPFHHGKENLHAMEDIKLWYSHCLLDQKPPLATTMECLVRAIRAIEGACRDCYGEKISYMSSDEFVEMMVIDGCFVIEFLRRYIEEVAEGEDCLFYTRSIFWAVLDDLLLLENQLPWRVLECLFDLTSKSGASPLPVLILNTFKAYTDAQCPKPSGTLKNRHLLDFIRNSLIGTYVQSESEENSRVSDLIPSVTELLRAGVKFKCGSVGENSMLNITFKNGMIEIPPILVLYENRESFFGNLIAYEQCQLPLGHQITSYVVLLDNLIKTSKDVDILAKKGIIQKIWSKKELSSLFRKAYNDTRLYNFSYVELNKEVNAFCSGGSWQKWKTILRRDYFKNPWSSSS